MPKFFSSALLITLLFIVACQPHASKIRADIDQRIENIENRFEAINIPENTIDIISFSGNKPDDDGTYDFQKDIQAAIDSLNQLGGGTLIFPHSKSPDTWAKRQDVYRIKGSLQLCSNLEMVINPSVKLFFEFDPVSYLVDGKPVLTRYEGNSLYTYSPLIRGFRVENVIIRRGEGRGGVPTIEGDGFKWQKWCIEGEAGLKSAGITPAYVKIREDNNNDVPIIDRWYGNPERDFYRPCMIEFYMSKNIEMDGVKLEDAPLWVVHGVFSENLRFKNLFYDALSINNDGIDPESCHNVIIENVIFNNYDDNIAIKAGRDLEGRKGALVAGTEIENVTSPFIKDGRLGGDSKDIVVRNCVFKGYHAVSIGSEMSGDVRNVYIVDNIAPQEIKSGIFIKSSRSRGGIVENIYASNLKINTAKHGLITVIPNYNNDTTSNFPPKIRNLYFEDITCKKANNGIRLLGWYDSQLENVHVNNVSVNNVAEKSLMVLQASAVKVDGFKANGKDLSGDYEHEDPNIIPPVQK